MLSRKQKNTLYDHGEEMAYIIIMVMIGYERDNHDMQMQRLIVKFTGFARQAFHSYLVAFKHKDILPSDHPIR